MTEQTSNHSPVDASVADQEAAVAAAAFLARYGGRTPDAYRHDLRGVFRWAADDGLEVLAATRPDIERYRAALEARGLAASTIDRRLSTVCGLYRFAHIDGRIAANPAQDVRRPPVHPKEGRGLDRHELARFLFADGTRLDRRTAHPWVRRPRLRHRGLTRVVLFHAQFVIRHNERLKQRRLGRELQRLPQRLGREPEPPSVTQRRIEGAAARRNVTTWRTGAQTASTPARRSLSRATSRDLSLLHAVASPMTWTDSPRFCAPLAVALTHALV